MVVSNSLGVHFTNDDNMIVNLNLLPTVENLSTQMATQNAF